MDWALAGSALVLGFLGSWHCGVMCGPLSCNFKKKSHFGAYHFGRLISYSLIGGLLFWGAQFFANVESRGLKIMSAVIFAGVFIFFGLKQLNLIKFKMQVPFLYRLQFKLLKKSQALIEKFPLILGLLTGLFPCGWLYSFLVLASQAKNLITCLGVVFIFWMTSLPAFFVFNGFIQTLISRSPVSYQKIAGLVLIFAGVLSIVGHWSYLLL